MSTNEPGALQVRWLHLWLDRYGPVQPVQPLQTRYRLGPIRLQGAAGASRPLPRTNVLMPPSCRQPGANVLMPPSCRQPVAHTARRLQPPAILASLRPSRALTMLHTP